MNADENVVRLKAKLRERMQSMSPDEMVDLWRRLDRLGALADLEEAVRRAEEVLRARGELMTADVLREAFRAAEAKW